MGSYYNTTRATGQRLLEFHKKAETQEDKLYDFLVKRPYHWFTPESLRLLVFSQKTPITSIRRALTNLNYKGKIVRSDTVNALGEYGHPVHTYCCKENIHG